MKILQVVFTVAIVLCVPAHAQEREQSHPSGVSSPTVSSVPASESGVKPGVNVSPATKQSSSRELKVLSSFEFWLSVLVLLFGSGVLLIEFLQLRAIRVTAEDSLRIYAVTLIVIGTLFAITAGFDAIQVAPAMGLFGTIAGYLLGRRSLKQPSSDQTGDAQR